MELVLDNTPQMPTLCLNMIVKNESKIITRLFDSVIDIIDCYCICDTGSSDNTVELIKTYFSNKNIPGKVVLEPFKNFCYNRNFALKSCIGMSDFVLLLDADMILDVKEFNKMYLNIFDSYTILQGNEHFYYQNVRIVRNNGLYNYSGVTHEYINTPSNNKSGHINKSQLFIKDIGDGGSKHDKFERDIRLLTEGIKDEPNNERYHFYLANTYCDSGKYEEAIKTYEKRIKLGGWNQEVWYSYYKMGHCYKNLDNISEAIYTWMNGYDFLPNRLEGLYEIIKHYRIISKHKLAAKFYEIAKIHIDSNISRDNYLFLHNDVYTYKLYYEYTIIAAYIGINNINDEIIKILNNSTDDSEKNNLLSNMKFYINILKPINTIKLDSTIIETVNNDDYKFISSSSCIIPHPSNKNKYIMNIRYVNYFITEKGNYLNCDKHIITKNKFVELDNNLNIIEDSVKWFSNEQSERRYIGIEDVRIYNDLKNDKLLFIGTGFHKSNKIGMVNGEYDTNKDELISSEINSSFNNSYCEKNWVYVDYKDETHIIYDWYPLQICKINDQTNLIYLIDTKSMPLIFQKVRGSSCGFKYNNEKWFINHIVSYEDPRHYYHIISVFDSNMNLLRYSAPFKFEGDPIEYSLSIIVEDSRVLINYSNWDRTTRIGIYDKIYINSLLKY